MPDIVSNYVQVHIASLKSNEYEFLALKRAPDLKVYPNLWQVITGTIENNETAIQTAVREIKEETGLQILKIWALPIVTSFYSPKFDRIQLSPVFGALVDETSQVILSNEHQEFRWLTLVEHIKLIELKSHKDASKIFYDEILNNENCIINEIDLN